MKIKYFEDTDTALLEFWGGTPAETRELSEDIYLGLDESGPCGFHHRRARKHPR